MKKLSLIAMMLVAWTATASANQEITLLVPAKPGGLANIQADTLKSAAAQQKVNIDIEFTTTCQNAARLLSQNKPVTVILATHIYADSRCNFPKIERSQLLTYAQQQPLMICHKKDRGNLNVQHFRDPAISKSVAVIHYLKNVTDNFLADQKINNVKVVSVGQSNDVRAQTFLNEFEYFQLDADYATKNSDRIACFANTGNHEIFGVPALKTVFARPSSNSEFYVSHFIVTNERNPEFQRKLFSNLVNSEIWTRYMSNQNGVSAIPKNVDTFEYLNSQSKLFAQ